MYMHCTSRAPIIPLEFLLTTPPCIILKLIILIAFFQNQIPSGVDFLEHISHNILKFPHSKIFPRNNAPQLTTAILVSF